MADAPAAAAPAAPSAEAPAVMSGYLTKQGGTVKSWKKRYFVLRNNKLQYYKSQKDMATDLGVIDLSECDKLVESTVKPHGFEIHTPNRIFRIVADNNEDKEAWVLAVKPRIGTGRGREGDSSDEDEHEKFGEPMEIIQPPEGYADSVRKNSAPPQPAETPAPAVPAASTETKPAEEAAQTTPIAAPAEAQASTAGDGSAPAAPTATSAAPAEAPAEPAVKPTISGYLTKQGGAHKSWKRRYFALVGAELKYYKSEKDKNHLGMVDLKKSTAVKPTEVKGLERVIAIVTASRTYLVSAPTDADYQAWLTVLQPLVPPPADDGNESDDDVLEAKDETATSSKPEEAAKPAGDAAAKEGEAAAKPQEDAGAAAAAAGDAPKAADVIRQGFLTKQGGKQKTWKRRFFVLRGTDLQYFKSDKEKDAIGTIDLTKCSGISKVAARGAKPNSFAIATPTRTYIIAAASSDEMDEWVHVLEDVVPEDQECEGEGAADGAAGAGDDRVDDLRRKLEVVSKENERLQAEKAELEQKLREAEAKLADLEKRFGAQ